MPDFSTLLSDQQWMEGLLQISLLGLGVLFVFFCLRFFLRVYIQKSKTHSHLWTRWILHEKMSSLVAGLIGLFLFHLGIQALTALPESVFTFAQRISLVSIVIVALSFFSTLFLQINSAYSQLPLSKNRPIKGYLQIASLVLYILGFILCISILLDRSPLVFLSGLGAMTAILLLVFRDTLLSLVAGTQLISNDLIRVGDWIEMPQFNADGDVVDIALHTVRVQNWDRTITVIPTHKFLEHSFKNWRGMQESGGRRIKRSIYIDLNSIRFLTEKEIDSFRRFELIHDYILKKNDEICEYNKSAYSKAAPLTINGRSMTNVGTFRAYLEKYLQAHPKLHKNMTCIVRQLQPDSHGLPIEIYVFTNDIAWKNYEDIQSDIFDHIFAIASEFGLKLYQNPSGEDLRQLRI